MYEPKANLEVEKKLLCSLMLKEGEAISAVSRMIEEEDFYRPEHRMIYGTIMGLYKQGVKIDFATVKSELYDNGLMEKVNRQYYDGLEGVEYTTVRAEYYARVVRKKAGLRALIDAGREIADEAQREQVPFMELIDRAEKKILRVTAKDRRGGLTGLKDILEESFDRITARLTGQETGVLSGFADLDKLLCGFQASDLILLAARPSVGKTALALNMAVNAALRGKKIVVFSLEMSRQQLGSRILSSWSGINSQKMNSGQLEKEDITRLSETANELSKLKLYMDDTAGIGLLEMRSKVRRLQHESGLDMIIIDYLQLMQGGRAENRQQEISEISRGLKAMARELKVPVMALSQLSRSVEMRAEKKPQLSDLRESGSLEQDADVVMFLYRDEYYNRDDPTNENIAEVIVAKNRNGPTTAVRLHFDKLTMKFGNLTREVID